MNLIQFVIEEVISSEVITCILADEFANETKEANGKIQQQG